MIMNHPVFAFGFVATVLTLLAPGCSTEVVPGSASCNEYLDEAQVQEVTITIRNNGSDIIYLGGEGCSSEILLSLAGADGELPWRSGGCGFSCEDLQQHSGVCAADCAMPPVVRVDPGGSYELSWTGRHLQQQSMPDGCFDEPQYAGEGSCQSHVVAAAGDYTLSAYAWLQTGCVDTTCDCQPDANGSCRMEGFASTDGPGIQADGVVSYPSATSMELVFE
jgi:hypothetical protein